MIKLLGKIPNQFYLACSGGVDSMVALDFFLNGKYRPIIVHFDHGTDHGHDAKEFVRRRCRELNLKFISGQIGRSKKSNESIEEYWREERYSYFGNFPGKLVTVHHLDDVVEWWLFSSLHGKSRLIPYQNRNVIRPFLLTSKEEIKEWAQRKSVEYIDDPSNSDDKYMRNYIREHIVPHALKVNPGLRKVIKKKLQEQGIVINRIEQKPEV